MKGTTVAALLIVLIIGSSPFIAARGVQKPVPRDEFLYTYFSQVLERFGDSLKYTLNGDPYGLTLANTTLYELDLLREEIIYYQSRGGVNGKASEVLPPFYSFSRNLVILDELMLEYYNTSDPALVVGIRNTARDMESILREIENITLLNGDEVLRFDTRKVDSYLRRVIETVSSRKPRITNLTLSVTDNRPILNETVTFFGATPENGTLTLIIAGENVTIAYLADASNGYFSVKHTFTELGNYTAYAVQGNMTSNKVHIQVRKIPTSFIVTGETSAVINTTLTLKAKLVDYYGNALANRTVLVDGVPIMTDENGTLSRDYFSPIPAVITVPLEFEGDKTHDGTATNVTLVFRKIAVSISLAGPDSITAGKTGKFHGTMTPGLNTTVLIYVNDTPAMNVTVTNGSFSFILKPKKPGIMKVYALFAGDPLHEKAASNTLIVTIEPVQSSLWRYLLVLLIIASIGALLVVGERSEKPSPFRLKRSEKPIQTPLPIIKFELEPREIPEDVGEAYTMIRDLLKERLGIPKSLTPREALRVLKDWGGHYEDLRKVTEIHERWVYGGMKVSAEELVEFMEAVKRLMGVLA